MAESAKVLKLPVNQEPITRRGRRSERIIENRFPYFFQRANGRVILVQSPVYYDMRRQRDAKEDLMARGLKMTLADLEHGRVVRAWRDRTH